MKLNEWPNTEREYWETIEALGGFLWSMEHELCDGRIKSTPELERDLKDGREISEKLVSELFELFGVVAPKDCPGRRLGGEKSKAPAGMMWYWNWYDKMKTEARTEEYNVIICSACSLSRGVESFIGSGHIPCGAFHGSMYRLRVPYQCGRLGCSDNLTREQLIEEIREKSGDEAVHAFEKKESELTPESVKAKQEKEFIKKW